jgi:hypothetical protein
MFFHNIILGIEKKGENKNGPGHWWLTLIILATWETEIRRIMVQSQPEQIV